MSDYYQLQKARDLRVKWDSLDAAQRVRQMAGLPPAEREEFERIRNAANAKATPQKPQIASVKPKRQGYGRWEMFNKFIDLTLNELTPAQRVVWLTMFRRADGKDNTLESSVRVIASQTGLTDKTVQRALVKLVKTGWLMYIFKSPSKGTPSRFRILTKRAESVVISSTHLANQ
ncbi:MAG: helix-turn-helix domain-containing protein [Pirellulales bacterium]